MSIARNCPNLVLLDISWCDMITGNGIKSLAEGCKKLQNFIAKGCMHIHDEGLLHLARNCKDLRKVNVQGCRNVQDEGVTRLAEACPNLEYLCVSNCSHLTDTSLLGIIHWCHYLIQGQFSKSSRIILYLLSWKSLFAIFSYCKRLSKPNYIGVCSGIPIYWRRIRSSSQKLPFIGKAWFRRMCSNHRCYLIRTLSLLSKARVYKFIPLRADHRRRDPSTGHGTVFIWAFDCPRAWQFTSNHRC